MFLSDANMVETNSTGRIKIVASINEAGKVNTPSLCCTTLTLESTVERRQTYTSYCCIMFADLNEVLFPRTWLSRHWAKVTHGGNLRASEANKNSFGGADSPLGHSQQFCKERQKGMKDWREVWSMLALISTFHAIFLCSWDLVGQLTRLWCTQPSSRDLMSGSEDAANLEYICNQMWIFCIDDTE